MMELQRISRSIKGHKGYAINIDIHYKEESDKMPIAIFAHGYKGFKDFGAWSLIADQMAAQGIVFVRFNFSHNGTEIENPTEFTRLDLFAENNFSIEQEELSLVINDIYSEAAKRDNWNEKKISLIGHSRGGGMVILAAHNKKIHSLITWASIKDVFDMTPQGKELSDWKKNGVRFVVNGRTKQNMPHNYQFYLDTINNKDQLSIEDSAKNLQKAWLIIHGDNDEAVPLSFAEQLHKWNPLAHLVIIKNGSHTFSISHPWSNSHLSDEMQEVVNKSMVFIKKY